MPFKFAVADLPPLPPLCSAGELKPAEIDKVLDVIAKPEDYKVET